mmetsp:Transcript_2979/g.7404  ORF Transcript_2979/g.7404 Transcript_2979/m.7404 type:complete len:170 (+) Transcript_2979:38-547(+)
MRIEGLAALCLSALAVMALAATLQSRGRRQVMLAEGRVLAASRGVLQQDAHGARTQALWDDYWPGARSVRARFQRVKMLMARWRKRNKGISGQKQMDDPVRFCRNNFPPASYFDQAEFHACLDAIGAKKVRLEWGDSRKVTDITGTPGGRDEPDGPNSLSPGSDGWSRN